MNSFYRDETSSTSPSRLTNAKKYCVLTFPAQEAALLDCVDFILVGLAEDQNQILAILSGHFCVKRQQRLGLDL